QEDPQGDGRAAPDLRPGAGAHLADQAARPRLKVRVRGRAIACGYNKSLGITRAGEHFACATLCAAWVQPPTTGERSVDSSGVSCGPLAVEENPSTGRRSCPPVPPPSVHKQRSLATCADAGYPHNPQ